MASSVAMAQESKVHSLSVITVTAEKDESANTDGLRSYKANAATGATKTATALKEIPQSIAVVTQERIRDQGLRTAGEALQQVPGVVATSLTGWTSIRGFGAQTSVNGVATSGLVGRTQADIAVFDRVEVLKGPSGLLSGSGSPGGSINYEFKKPTHEFQSEATIAGGSDNTLITGVDVSGSLNQSNTLRARGIVLRDKRDEFVDVDSRNRTSLYGVVEYDFTPATTASLGYYKQDNKSIGMILSGLPAYTDGGLLWDADRRTSATQDWSWIHYQAEWLLADVQHKFNDNWNAKLSFRQTHNKGPNWINGPYMGRGEPGVCGERYEFVGVDRNDPSTRKRCYTTSYSPDESKNRNLDAYVSGKISLFGYEHEVLLGIDSNRNAFSRAGGATASGDDNFFNDIFNPNPHVIDAPARDFIEEDSGFSVSRQHGVYLRSTLQLTDWLKVPVGGRLTYVKSSSGEKLADGKFTPYFGLVAELNSNVTTYGSYTKIFNSSSFSRAWSATVPEGTLLPPEEGKQVELGIKTSWLDDALSATAAIYELELDNTTRTDTLHPRFSIPTGSQRTRGFELDVQGRVADGWNIGTAYALTDAKYVSDDYAAGQRKSNSPRHSVNLYSNYRFDEQSALRGLSIGGGLRYSSEILGDTLGPRSVGNVRLRAPGYTTVSLRAGYEINRYADFSVNVNNLFDKHYWQELSSVTDGNYYGAPRNVLATLRLKY